MPTQWPSPASYTCLRKANGRCIRRHHEHPSPKALKPFLFSLSKQPPIRSFLIPIHPSIPQSPPAYSKNPRLIHLFPLLQSSPQPRLYTFIRTNPQMKSNIKFNQNQNQTKFISKPKPQKQTAASSERKKERKERTADPTATYSPCIYISQEPYYFSRFLFPQPHLHSHGGIKASGVEMGRVGGWIGGWVNGWVDE